MSKYFIGDMLLAFGHTPIKIVGKYNDRWIIRVFKTGVKPYFLFTTDALLDEKAVPVIELPASGG